MFELEGAPVQCFARGLSYCQDGTVPNICNGHAKHVKNNIVMYYQMLQDLCFYLKVNLNGIEP